MHAPDPDTKRKQRRDRQQRWRQRQSDSALSVTLTVTPSDTAKLHRLRYLAKHELEDRKRIAEAISRLLANIVFDDDDDV